jgi:hypothetical protein
VGVTRWDRRGAASADIGMWVQQSSPPPPSPLPHISGNFGVRCPTLASWFARSHSLLALAARTRCAHALRARAARTRCVHSLTRAASASPWGRSGRRFHTPPVPNLGYHFHARTYTPAPPPHPARNTRARALMHTHTHTHANTCRRTHTQRTGVWKRISFRV